MVKNTQTVTVTTPIADGDPFTTALVNAPRDIQYDVKTTFTLGAGTVSGNIVVELISVGSDSTEYLPADSDDNRTITLLSDTLTAEGTVSVAKGIDRVAGINNLKFKITNNSGVSITAASIELGKLQF